MSKVEECNRCKDSGYPGQMISFRKSSRIDPATGKSFWDLINPDNTEHEHRGKTVQNGHFSIDEATVVKTLENLTNSVNALVFALCSETELQRVQARAMVTK